MKIHIKSFVSIFCLFQVLIHDFIVYPSNRIKAYLMHMVAAANA